MKDRKCLVEREREVTWEIYGYTGFVDSYENYKDAVRAYGDEKALYGIAKLRKKTGIAKLRKKTVTITKETETYTRWET